MATEVCQSQVTEIREIMAIVFLRKKQKSEEIYR